MRLTEVRLRRVIEIGFGDGLTYLEHPTGLWADRTKFVAEDDSSDKMLIPFLLLLTRLI